MFQLGSAIVSPYNTLPFVRAMGLPRKIDPPLYNGSILSMLLGAYLAARCGHW